MLAPEHRLFARVALLPEGWAKDVRLSISKGLIQHVEVSVEPGHEDERHAVILPGLPNLHSHAFQRGMAGLTESRGPSADSLWAWAGAM